MEWKIYSLSDLAELISSGGDAAKYTCKNHPFGEFRIPVYANAIEKNGLYGYTNKAVIIKDALTIAARGAGVGFVAFRKAHFVPIVRLITIIPKDSIATAKFLSYYLKTQQIIGGGAAIPQLTVPMVQKIKVCIPPLPIQRKIASILSTYDNLIENNAKRIKLLEQMAENLYKEWFVRFRFPGHEHVEMVNGLPKGWKVERIKECVKRLPYGKTYKANELYTEGNVIVIDQSTSDYLGYHNDAPSHYASFESPIILFGDHSCKFCFMTRDFSLGENVIPFKPKDIQVIDDYYLYFSTHKLIVTEEYKRHWGRFSSMKILIPQMELQQEFRQKVIEFEKMKQKLISQSQLLTRQRDLLLPRLMSGKLEAKL